MGKVLDPRPPRWARRTRPEETDSDIVIALCLRLFGELNTVDPTVVQLTALRLVQKAVISNYQAALGTEATKEALRQASEMAAQYIINGIDDEHT